MTDGDPEIVDRSRVDAYAATRRRAMFLHSVWRPLLAGAVGAALVIGAVWVTLPKISYREIVVPAVTLKDTEVPRIILKDAVVPNIVLKDVPIEIPRIVTVTPTEQRFLESPAFAAAPMHGRIVPSRSERALSFDDGSDYTPTLPGMAADAAPLLGLWGYCSATDAAKTIFHCFALLRDGTVISVPQKPVGRPT